MLVVIDKDKGKGVDYSGKDLVRACFLSHDERALMRVKTPMGPLPPLTNVGSVAVRLLLLKAFRA